ncbi:MAG: hypothetical protein WBA12_10000 [Catalinimonas sp.]
MPFDKFLLLSNWLATAFMTGVIWYVQVVHYPIFHRVRADFVPFHTAHTSTTGRVVMVPMLIELALAAWLVLRPPAWLPAASVWVGLGLVLLVWAITFFVSVPLHERLAHGYDAAAVRRLVGTNWLRTVLWTLRLGLVTWWVGRLL